MLLNASGRWYLLHRDGTSIVEGEDHPDGVMLLAAPGAPVDASWLARHPGLADLLGPPAAAPEAPAEAPAVEVPADISPIGEIEPEPAPMPEPEPEPEPVAELAVEVAEPTTAPTPEPARPAKSRRR